MERDFTTACYDKFCALIDRINDENWCGITDWFGDRFSDLRNLLSKWGVLGRATDIEAYYKELLDRKNTSKEHITQVFDAAVALDRSFIANGVGYFGHCGKQLDTLHWLISSLTQIAAAGQSGGDPSRLLNTSMEKTLLQLQPSRFTASTFSSVTQEEKETYIIRWEILRPEQAKAIDRIFSDPDWTDQEKLDIKFLIYSAPEPYRSLYLKHADFYKLNLFQIGSKDSGGLTNSGYVPSIGLLLLEDSDITRDNKRGPYATFFHESGHMLDDLAHPEDWLSGNYEFSGSSLHNRIAEDVRNYVSNFIDKEYADLTSQQRELLLGSFNLSDQPTYTYAGNTNGLSPALKVVREDIINAVNKSLKGDANCIVSSACCGITNAVFIGDYGHRKKEGQKPEDFHYWYKDKTATMHQGMEVWAEFFSSQMTHDEEALAAVKEHLPNTYQALEEMAREMAAK